MKNKAVLLLMFLFFLTIKTKGQANNREAAVYNTGLGCILGRIRAIINKESGEKK